MTRQELVEMVGSEAQANMAMEIVLKNVKSSFVTMAIRAELKEIEAQVKEMKAENILVECNGTLSINWHAAEEVFGDEPGACWTATEEQKEKAETIESKCREADALLHKRNRVISLLAVR